MPTLQEALKLPENTNVTLEVKVIECKEQLRTSSNNKCYFDAVVADKSGSAHIRVFKSDLHAKFMTLPSLLLQDAITKSNTLLMTVKSKAQYCAPVTADANTQLTTPSKTQVPDGSIKEVLASTTKMDMVCRVLKSSPLKTKTSSYTGLQLSLRHLIVKDATSTAKVALWEKCATSNIDEGAVVKISGVKCTSFNKKPLIGSTQQSAVEFLPDDSAIPISTDDDKQIWQSDPDFSDTNSISATLKAFDNIKIYPVCENRACNNKELTSDTCSSCGKNQSKTKLYSRVTLTLDTGISFHTLSMFYPEYCTLCAYADLDSTLKEEVVVSNITSLLGQCIYYNIKNSSISEVTLKRASSSDD